MEKIQIRCEHCSTLLAVPQAAGGKKIHCPKCQEIIVVTALKTRKQNGQNKTKIATTAKKSTRPREDLPPAIAERPKNRETAQSRPSRPSHEVDRRRINVAPDKASGVNKTLLIVFASLIGVALVAGSFLVYRYGSARRVEVTAEERKAKEEADKKQLEVARKAAARIFVEAKQKLDEGLTLKGMTLLEEFIADPNAINADEAQQILAEAIVATSNAAAMETLMSLDDEVFARVKDTGDIDDGKVLYPSLVTVRRETLVRNWPEAAEQRNTLVAEKQREEAKKLAEEVQSPLNVFLGGVLAGPPAAYYRLVNQPQMKQVEIETNNPFEKADLRGLESQFEVDKIFVADGALMSIQLSHYIEDEGFGEHSRWLWTIALAVPSGTDHYQGVTFDYLLGNEVERVFFKLNKTVQVESLTFAVYVFEEMVKNSDGKFLYRPADKILRRMLSAGDIKYRLFTGPSEAGLTYEGSLSHEATVAITELLQQMKFRNRSDRMPYAEAWMDQ